MPSKHLEPHETYRYKQNKTWLQRTRMFLRMPFRAVAYVAYRFGCLIYPAFSSDARIAMTCVTCMFIAVLSLEALILPDLLWNSKKDVSSESIRPTIQALQSEIESLKFRVGEIEIRLNSDGMPQRASKRPRQPRIPFGPPEH